MIGLNLFHLGMPWSLVNPHLVGKLWLVGVMRTFFVIFGIVCILLLLPSYLLLYSVVPAMSNERFLSFYYLGGP